MLEPSHLFDTIMAAARKLNPVIVPSTVVAYLVCIYTYDVQLMCIWEHMQIIRNSEYDIT
jgi:hypothetical protein